MKDPGKLPSLAIANYFVQKGLDEGGGISPMQAIKLTYIAHGWHLAFTDDPLLREDVEAWKFGPVIRSIYDAFRRNGNKPIKELATSWGPNGSTKITVPSDESRIPLLERIWEVYRKYSGGQLSTLTHEVGTPWHTIWIGDNGRNRFGAVIPDELIKKYYKSRRKHEEG